MSKEFLNKRELVNSITPVIENTAMRYGLIPLEISLEKENGHWFLRIFIYSNNHNVSHLDCENMSRGLGDMLDEIIPFKYFLEVSSPGLDRKFKSEKEYIIFKGHNIILKLKNQIEQISSKTIEAKILDYKENLGVLVEFENEKIIIPIANIHSAKLNDKIEINKNKGDYDD